MSGPRRCSACGHELVVAVDATAVLRCPECRAPLPDEPQIPSTLREAFDVECELGRGACGAVFLVRERATGERRALKVLTRDGREMAERFRREGQALLAIDHAHVVRVFAADDRADAAYLLSEYMEGGTLRQELERDGRLAPARAAAVLADVLEGLAACHARGVVHRDLKPENILFDRAGRAKLADLGIARFTEGDATALTQAGALIGTPRYMAPEQLRGEPAGPPADLFAAGVVLHELLTGRPPYDTANVYELASQHANLGVPPLDVDAPDALARLREELLAPAPADRPPGATAALARLRAPAQVARTQRNAPSGPGGANADAEASGKQAFSAPRPGPPSTPPSAPPRQKPSGPVRVGGPSGPLRVGGPSGPVRRVSGISSNAGSPGPALRGPALALLCLATVVLGGTALVLARRPGPSVPAPSPEAPAPARALTELIERTAPESLIPRLVADPKWERGLDFPQLVGQFALEQSVETNVVRKRTPPGYFREQLRLALQRTGVLPAMEAFRGVAPVYWSGAAPMAEKLRTYAALLRLELLDVAILAQYDGQRLGVRELFAPFVERTYRISDTLAPLPRGWSPVIPEETLWGTDDFDQFTTLSFFDGFSTELCAKLGWPKAALRDPRPYLKGRRTGHVSVPATAAPGDLLMIEAVVTLLGPGHYFDLAIAPPGGEPLCVRIGQPGLPEWFRSMDDISTMSVTHDEAMRSGHMPPMFGVIRTFVPAAAVPRGELVAEVTYRHLPGVTYNAQAQIQRGASLISLRAHLEPGTPH